MPWQEGSARYRPLRPFTPAEGPGWPDIPRGDLGRLTLEAWSGLYLALGQLCRVAGLDLPPGWPEILGGILPEELRLRSPEDWELLAEILLYHENLLLSLSPAELPFWLVEDPPGLRADLEEAGFLDRADDDNL